jgi:GNAT superfamily N-acetyltransferase
VSIRIRTAEPKDGPLIYQLVRELAEYERLSHEVDATEQQLVEALFSAQPRLFCDIAEWDGEPAGFALWFLNFSSFRGRFGVYLEDLFVRPAFRGKGLGKALMEKLAERCVHEGWTRFEWSVLDWNKPAIDFYRATGATVMEDWRICRLTGAALADFARGAR